MLCVPSASPTCATATRSASSAAATAPASTSGSSGPAPPARSTATASSLPTRDRAGSRAQPMPSPPPTSGRWPRGPRRRGARLVARPRRTGLRWIWPTTAEAWRRRGQLAAQDWAHIWARGRGNLAAATRRQCPSAAVAGTSTGSNGEIEREHGKNKNHSGQNNHLHSRVSHVRVKM